VALFLKRQGVQKIRPLAGGLAAWRKMGYPIAEATVEVEANARAARAGQTHGKTS
jgi:3-mercaptopyruvate sulfurtransferase SseA